jgi:predicted amidophosphoribosyltransferase
MPKKGYKFTRRGKVNQLNRGCPNCGAELNRENNGQEIIMVCWMCGDRFVSTSGEHVEPIYGYSPRDY